MIKIPFSNSYSDDENSDDEETIKINVKRLKNTSYDIILSNCILKSNTISTYECIDINTKNKYIVDIYNYINEFNIDEKITSIRKINNPNIIKIIDIINYKFAVYIIKENITDNDNYNFCEISNIENLAYYKIILASIKYLLDLKIEIDVIKIDNIYIVDNQIIINPIFKFTNTNNNNIIFGSPIYSSPNIFQIKNNSNYNFNINYNIIWNLGLLLYQIMYKIDIFELYNKNLNTTYISDLNNIKNMTIENINIKNIILKMLNNDKHHLTINMIYTYFNQEINIENNIEIDSDKSDDSNQSGSELFSLDL